jgi:hypothetical protein
MQSCRFHTNNKHALAKAEYVKNGHTRLHSAGVKLGFSYLGNFYKTFYAAADSQLHVNRDGRLFPAQTNSEVNCKLPSQNDNLRRQPKVEWAHEAFDKFNFEHFFPRRGKKWLYKRFVSVVRIYRTRQHVICDSSSVSK